MCGSNIGVHSQATRNVLGSILERVKRGQQGHDVLLSRGEALCVTAMIELLLDREKRLLGRR